jgi:hypothetical protein
MVRCLGFLGVALSLAMLAGGVPATAQTAPAAGEGAGRRPHIVIRPRRLEPGPNSKRYCRFWLAQEYRVSGPVIVPAQQCWWQ